MNRILLLSAAMVFSASLSAQQWMTRSGSVSFFSATPAENIEAQNEQMSAILDSEGRFAFQVPILGFRFERALMEEHFNENYMETSLHPKASFEGLVMDFNSDLKDGEWHGIQAVGILTVHGIAMDRTINSKIQFQENTWVIQSEFTVSTADHEIRIPRMVEDKIAAFIEVTVNADLSL